MALMDCPECGHKVSTEANSCPSCGKPTKLVFTPRSKSRPKKRGPAVGLVFALLLVIGGMFFVNDWIPSWIPALFTTKADIETSVGQMMQQKFDSTPALQIYHLHVERVDLIHIDGPRYKGMVKVTANGSEHQIPVDVTADGDNVMYEADTAALLPIAFGQ